MTGCNEGISRNDIGKKRILEPYILCKKQAKTRPPKKRRVGGTQPGSSMSVYNRDFPQRYDVPMPQMLVNEVRKNALMGANDELMKIKQDFRALREQYNALQAEREEDQQRFCRTQQEQRFDKARGNVARNRKQAVARRNSEGCRPALRAIARAASPIGAREPDTTLPGPPQETLVTEQEVRNVAGPSRYDSWGDIQDSEVQDPLIGAVNQTTAVNRMVHEEEDWVGEWGGNSDVGTVRNRTDDSQSISKENDIENNNQVLCRVDRQQVGPLLQLPVNRPIEKQSKLQDDLQDKIVRQGNTLDNQQVVGQADTHGFRRQIVPEMQEEIRGDRNTGTITQEDNGTTEGNKSVRDSTGLANQGLQTGINDDDIPGSALEKDDDSSTDEPRTSGQDLETKGEKKSTSLLTFCDCPFAENHGEYVDGVHYAAEYEPSYLERGDLQGVVCRGCRRRIVGRSANEGEVRATRRSPVYVCVGRNDATVDKGRGCKESVCHSCFAKCQTSGQKRTRRQRIPNTKYT